MKMSNPPGPSDDLPNDTHPNISTLNPIPIFRMQEVDDVKQIQVLDELLPTPSNEDVAIAELPNKSIRRIEAAHQTWTAINNYIQHNYLENWIPKMSKYFNKLTNFGDDIWDSPRPDDVQVFECPRE